MWNFKQSSVPALLFTLVYQISQSAERVCVCFLWRVAWLIGADCHETQYAEIKQSRQTSVKYKYWIYSLRSGLCNPLKNKKEFYKFRWKNKFFFTLSKFVWKIKTNINISNECCRLIAAPRPLICIHFSNLIAADGTKPRPFVCYTFFMCPTLVFTLCCCCCRSRKQMKIA